MNKSLLNSMDGSNMIMAKIKHTFLNHMFPPEELGNLLDFLSSNEGNLFLKPVL